MANTPARFTQKDIERTVKGVMACGLSIKSVVVRPDGAIQVDHGTSDVDVSKLSPLERRNLRKNANGS